MKFGLSVVIDSTKTLKSVNHFNTLNVNALANINNLMARRAQARVQNVIRDFNNKNSSTHNTQESLTKTVIYHKQKTITNNNKMIRAKIQKGNYVVEMKQRDSESVNPEWVEYGTKAHDQPNNPVFKVGGHPGAKPSRPFERGIRRFRAKDIPDLKTQLRDDIIQNIKKVGFAFSPI